MESGPSFKLGTLEFALGVSCFFCVFQASKEREALARFVFCFPEKDGEKTDFSGG